MVSFKYITALLCCVVSVYGITRAQQPYYQEQTNYSPLTDIKQVTGIAADKNNCIWLATQEGLYRYDGNHFRHYNTLNTPVLKFERFAEIFPTVSQKGYSWCLKDAKGNRYAPDSLSRITSFKPDTAAKEMVTHSIYGYENLLPGKRYELDKDIIDVISEANVVPRYHRIFLQMFNGTIRSMDLDDMYRSGKGDSLYSIQPGQINKTFSTDKNFYLVTSNNILRWEGLAKKPIPVILNGDILNNKTIGYDSLKFYATTEPGVILLGYKGCIYEASEMNGRQILNTRLLLREASQKLPLLVYYSPSLRIILSYFLERGLVIYRPTRFSLLTWNGPGGIIPKVDYYYSVIPDGDGIITINNNGIIRFSIKGEKKVLLQGPCSKFFFYKDSFGNLWYENMQTGYICYMQTGQSKSIAVIPIQIGAGFSGAYQLNDSVYYILTSNRLSKVTRRSATDFLRETLLDNAGTGEEFNVLFELNKDDLWVGSDRGLTEFHVSDNSSKPIVALNGSYIRSAIRLEKDNYLVGTYDKGIFQYLDNKWTQLPSAEGRLPSSAHAFVVDSITHCVWISSNEGLSRIPLSMLLRDQTTSNGNSRIGFINNFGPEISSEFNGSSNISAAKLSDSCIAFANAKGIVIFNPLKLGSYPLPVRVLVESLPENQTIGNVKKKSDPTQLLFTPVVPYYGDAGDLEVSYRLTGTDKEWHTLSGNPIISYNNVKPGDHDLQFRISNFHSTDGSELLLTSQHYFIPARWYQRTWFKATVLALVIAIIILVHNIRIWYLRKRKRELEQIVKNKTSELEETNENLLNVIEELHVSADNLTQSNYLKDEYYAVLTHDLRSPMRFLSFNISRLLEQFPGPNMEATKKGLFAAYECTTDVSKLIDEFIYWIQDNEKQLQVNPMPVLVAAVITDIKKLYGFSLESNGNTLVTEASPGLRFMTDPKILFIILRNAVDNANKYTDKGQVTVSAILQNNALQVTVADTGQGMNDELVEELINLQYKQDQFGFRQRKSLGFYIMAMLTRKLEGSYTIISTKGKGTSVCFIFPELKNENISNESVIKDH